jgi:hypothetical protein
MSAREWASPEVIRRKWHWSALLRSPEALTKEKPCVSQCAPHPPPGTEGGVWKGPSDHNSQCLKQQGTPQSHRHETSEVEVLVFSLGIFCFDLAFAFLRQSILWTLKRALCSARLYFKNKRWEADKKLIGLLST